MDENNVNVFTAADAADTTPVAVPLREIAGGYAYGDNGGVYEIPEITGADVRMDPEDEANIQETIAAMREAGNMNFEIDVGAVADASAASADEIRRAIDRLNEIAEHTRGMYEAADLRGGYHEMIDEDEELEHDAMIDELEHDATIDEDEERRFDGLANMVEARDFLREYDRRHINRAERHAVGGWTMADAENEGHNVRGRRAEMPLWEPILEAAEPPHDIMHLDEGTEFRIEGINWEGKERRRFVGYFAESDMEMICNGHIRDDEIAISYPARSLIFRHHGEVVAVPEDFYNERILYSYHIDSLENKVIVEVHVSAPNIDIVWHNGDGTVPMHEPLHDMDQAFDEVFQ